MIESAAMMVKPMAPIGILTPPPSAVQYPQFDIKLA